MLRSTFRVLSAASLAASLCLVPAHRVLAQTAVAPAASDVKVIDAGAAPRRALRYKLVQGTTESVTMRQKISMNIEMGGMALPSQSLPATVITSRLTVSEVKANGVASIAGEFVSVDIDADGADPMIVEAMRPQLAGLNGVTMSYTMNPNGEVSKMEFGANAPAAMQSLGSTEQLSVAFPTEPVGVGARWKASRPVTQSGMTILQDAEYVLKSLGADSMVLDIALVQSAKDQVMSAAAMPPGASAKLRSLDGKGTSTVVIRFDRVQPAMEMKMDIKMAIDLEMGGQTNAMNQSMVMEIKTTPGSKP
jgi:hypothetical protein